MVSLGRWALAAGVSVLVIGLLLRWELAHRIAADHPNARSLHATVIPRVGGLGVLAAFALLAPWGAGWRLMAAVLSLGALSLWDDRRGLPPLARFCAQILAATGLVVGLAPSAGAGLVLPAVLGLVWCANLYNFMDGSDGLAGAMAAIGFAALALAAPGADIAQWAWVASGAAVGFLAFNAPPARVFLGDCGSIPFGFLAGALGLMGWQRGLWPAWFPLLVFSPFWVDASLTLLRRALRGARVWEAHREHGYQRLVVAGYSKRQVLAGYGAVMLATTGTALTVLKQLLWMQHAMLVLWCIIHTALALWIERKWRRHLAAVTQK